MTKSTPFTRVGPRRLGDDYQDVFAVGKLVDLLEHPTDFDWIRVEAPDSGSLDDVVLHRADGTVEAYQVKFSAHPADEASAIGWDELFDREGGARARSLLMKWTDALEAVRALGAVRFAGLITNCRADAELAAVLRADERIDFTAIADAATRDKIVTQLGGDARARDFFAGFRFRFGQPSLTVLEEGARRRFFNLGGTNEGWLNLKDKVGTWACIKAEPPPDGRITLTAARTAALWSHLRSLPQSFDVPVDYTLPSREFHRIMLRSVGSPTSGCIVLTGPPGLGKSTYLSMLCAHLRKAGAPVLRHHYFISTVRHVPGRMEHERVAESLMYELQRDYPEALGEAGTQNPASFKLRNWLESTGRYFSNSGRRLVVIIDGLDHVWRSQGRVDELTALFDYLLPAPAGVTVLVGTQQVDDSQLPPGLLTYAPRNTWIDLPAFDRSAVRRWVLKHPDEFYVRPATDNDYLISELIAALMERSAGHPLHLRLMLRELQEQDLPANATTIHSIPACRHRDIVSYYDALWISLAEPARAVLQLLTACAFPWPEHGILDCLGRRSVSLTDAVEGLRLCRHLLARDILGLRLFHGSIEAYVQSRPDHEVYAAALKSVALAWLRSGADAQLRWSYEWSLEAELGNTVPLRDGPNREWVVQAIANRRPADRVSYYLTHAASVALREGRLARFVEVGLLHDYFSSVPDIQSGCSSDFLRARLSGAAAAPLRRVALASPDYLQPEEAVTVAEHELAEGNHDSVHRLFMSSNRQMGEHARSSSPHDGWETSAAATLRLAALDRDVGPKHVVEFIRRHSAQTSAFLIGEYAGELRRSRCIEMIGPLLSVLHRVTDQAKSDALLHVLALIKEVGISPDAFPAIQTLRACPAVTVALGESGAGHRVRVIAPDSTVLDEVEMWIRSPVRRKLFRDIAMYFCATHLLTDVPEDTEWIQRINRVPWTAECAAHLNVIGRELAELHQTTSRLQFKSLFELLKPCKAPDWRKDRHAYDQFLGASDAMIELALMLPLLIGNAPAGGWIGLDDLRAALNSEWCNSWRFLDRYLDIGRPYLTDAAACAFLSDLEAKVDNSLEQFPSLADSYGKLAHLAAIHGDETSRERLVKKASSALLAYGERKDTLLDEVLTTVRECGKAGIACVPSWVKELATPIAHVLDFTDGKETSHTPRELAEVVAEFMPDRLFSYYAWLVDREEFSVASDAFHALLRRLDFEDPLQRAIGATAIDPYSRRLLADRAAAGDARAAALTRDMDATFGSTSEARSEEPQTSASTSYERGEGDDAEPIPAQFAPGRLSAFLRAAGVRFGTERTSQVRRWLRYWSGAGEAQAALDNLDRLHESGVDLGAYDTAFEIALSSRGADDAFRWLVRDHRHNHGWTRYWTHPELSDRRWDIIRTRYPERWLRFIQESLDPMNSVERVYALAHDRICRLCQYCLVLGKHSTAEGIADQAVRSLVSLIPLPLQKPAWVE